MNLLELFMDKQRLELALAISRGVASTDAIEANLERAGIPAAERVSFLRGARLFSALRDEAQCASCSDSSACLDENQLAEFVEGVLTAEEAPVVERQLAHCGSCLRKAVELAELTHELNPPETFSSVVVGIVRRGLRVLSHAGEGFSARALQPAEVLSAACDSPAAQGWTVVHGDTAAHFTMTLEPQGTVALHIRFSVTQGPGLVGRVALVHEYLLLESQALSADGEHTFWNLEPGRYVIELDMPSQRTLSFMVEVRGDGKVRAC
ncbi:MAG: hypothetical protein GC168_18955 [Candidatus Hydrogenedens sp.]|nr:hypothetical protein [Candidatus Hydrogenedens sp.]